MFRVVRGYGRGVGGVGGMLEPGVDEGLAAPDAKESDTLGKGLSGEFDMTCLLADWNLEHPAMTGEGCRTPSTPRESGLKARYRYRSEGIHHRDACGGNVRTVWTRRR